MENKSKKYWLTETMIGAGCFVASLIYFGLSFQIIDKAVTKLKTNSIEPTLFPRVIALVAMVVSLSIFVSALVKYINTPADAEHEDEGRPKIFTQDRFVIWGCMIVYILIVKPVGYIISTFLLASVILNYIKKEKWVRNLIFSFVFSIVCFLVFNNLLSIWLPNGILEGLLYRQFF